MQATLAGVLAGIESVKGQQIKGSSAKEMTPSQLTEAQQL